MMSPSARPEAVLDPTGPVLNHVEFYVESAIVTAAELVQRYGFEPVATSGALRGGSERFSVVLRQGAIVLVLTQPQSVRHPAHAFLEAHGDGVCDIAFRTPDAGAAFRTAVARGAQPAVPLDRADPEQGLVPAIRAFGDVRHSFVPAPRDGRDGIRIPGFPEPLDGSPGAGLGLRTVDHFAVCLPKGELSRTVAYYTSVLGFEKTFEERIVVGSQAMCSEVVQDASRTVTFTLIQPDPSALPGQIDEFLDRNDGAGVQHVAFGADDAVRTVSALSERGVEFLSTPDTYYELLARRITPAAHTIDDLRGLGLLVDEDHDGQLVQIFTRSTHPRRTFFLEVIERMGASTFGSGNIRALYEAVEAERERSVSPA